LVATTKLTDVEMTDQSKSRGPPRPHFWGGPRRSDGWHCLWRF